MKLELDDILERVTRAEEQVKYATFRIDERHSETAALLQERHAETVESLQMVDARIKGLEQSLAKYTGFWGAIMLIGSAITTFFMLTKDFFAAKIGVHS
jgi:hypothetical protein